MEHDKLDRAQRRAAKIVSKTTDSDAEKTKVASMKCDMHTINLTFKCLKGSSLMFFKDYFKVFRTIHNTRSSRTCCSPKSELRRQGTLYFNGSKLFNNISCPTRSFKVDGRSNICIFNRFCKALASLVIICPKKFLQESVDHPSNIQPPAA